MVLKILDRGETFQAADQVRGAARTRPAQLALLALQLHVEAQVRHRVVCVGGLAALVAHHAAAELTVESAVEEALAFGVVTLGVAGGGGVEGIDEELEVFVGVLLAVACHFLWHGVR